MRKIQKSKMTKVFSWYYIFAFLAIFGLGVYLCSSFRIREGANEVKNEKVQALWNGDTPYYPATISQVSNDETHDIEKIPNPAITTGAVVADTGTGDAKTPVPNPAITTGAVVADTGTGDAKTPVPNPAITTGAVVADAGTASCSWETCSPKIKEIYKNGVMDLVWKNIPIIYPEDLWNSHGVCSGCPKINGSYGRLSFESYPGFIEGKVNTTSLGSFNKSCEDIKLSGTNLSAQCKKADGSKKSTAIDIKTCLDFDNISNKNGDLACENYS